jgi:predicted PhzF superfamily epimerase YddE/YHI9
MERCAPALWDLGLRIWHLPRHSASALATRLSSSRSETSKPSIAPGSTYEASRKSKEPTQNRYASSYFAATSEGAYSRMFAPEYGIVEDPATGSSTGPLAAYMIRHKLVSSRAATRFVSERGTKMGRRSILHVHIRGERGSNGIDVGGYVTPLVRAVMKLDEDATTG